MLIRDVGNLAHLVGGAEAVEEVDEGHAALQSGRVADGRHVRGFLRGGAAQHGKARGAAGHHIAVVAENGKTLGRKGSGRNVEDAGYQLARNLVHVRDHQQQALGGREGGGQRARLQSTVHGACRSGLALHLHDAGDRSPEVLAVHGRPGLCRFTHRRGRGDGVDRGHFRTTVRHGGYGLIGIYCAVCSAHVLVCAECVSSLACRGRRRGFAAHSIHLPRPHCNPKSRPRPFFPSLLLPPPRFFSPSRVFWLAKRLPLCYHSPRAGVNTPLFRSRGVTVALGILIPSD